MYHYLFMQKDYIKAEMAR